MNVPFLSSPNEVRPLLDADRPWAVYALGDLAPAHLPHCLWLSPAPASLALLYSAFDSPIFWAMGEPAQFARFSSQLFSSPSLILQIRATFVPLIQTHYRHVDLHPMWRMALRAIDFLPVPSQPHDRRLTPADLPALQNLYEDGRALNQQPDFFFPEMLASGVFYGAWRDNELIAAAGTHIVSYDESAAAIGNVYTRREARRRGHAARLTSLVAAELLDNGVRTVALSVRQSNPAAVAVYARLGFTTHCDFFEGFASRDPS